MPKSKRPTRRSRKRKAPRVEPSSTSSVDRASGEGSVETKRSKRNLAKDAHAVEADATETDNSKAKDTVDDNMINIDMVSKIPDLRRQKMKTTQETKGEEEESPKTPQQLEEEIFLAEQSLRTLLSRKQTIELQEQQSNAKRKDLLETLAHQMRRKQQLDESQVQHLRLLQELETSLAKSHDLLLRLNQSNTTAATNNDNSIIDTTSDDTDTSESNNIARTNGSDDSVAENEEQQMHEQEKQPQTNIHLTEPTASDTGAGSNNEEMFRRCPVPVLYHDKARLAAFWKSHSQLVPTTHAKSKEEEECHASSTTTANIILFVFSPCVSSPKIVEKIMTVTATETLAEGARLMAMAGDDATDILSAVAKYRRQTLWNTCLDFCLMSMGNSSNSDRNDKNGSSDKPQGNERNRPSEDGGKAGLDIGMEVGANVETGVGSGDVSATHDTIIIGGGTTQSTTADENEVNENLLHLDPNVALCPYELAGVCADSFCPFQHLNTKDRPSHEAVLPRELLPLPQLRLPEDPVPLESVLPLTLGLSNQGCVIIGSAVEKEEARDVQNKNGLSTSSGTDNVGNVTMEDITETETAVDEFIKGDPNRQNDSENVNIPDVALGEYQPLQEFEDNSDFVAFGEIDCNDPDDDDEDFMNLETAGLVGFTRENRPDLNKEVSLTNGRKKSFWWLPVSFGDKISDGTTKPTSVEDWLYSFGGLIVTRGGEDASSDIVLEFQGRKPISDVELCQFTGKIVDCSRLLLHAGRFDLSEPLCTLAQYCVDDFKANFLREEVHSPLLQSIQEVVNIFEMVFERTRGVLEEAFCHQNGIDITLSSQLSLALFSDFLERFHRQLTAEADTDADLNWCFDFLDTCMNTMKDCDAKKAHMDIGKATEESANYIRGTIKWAVFRNNVPPAYRVNIGAKYTKSKGQGASADQGGKVSIVERVSSLLLEDLRTALACASSIRSGFSLHNVADDFLRPIWSIVKTSLRPRALTSMSEIPHSTVCLRSVLFIVYSIKGAFEGAVDLLSEVAGDPHKLSALSYSSMVQLDIVCHGILKSLKSILSNNVDTNLFSTLVTPIMGASISFACHLGLYTKAQLRLEDLLDTLNKDSAVDSLFFCSELLWSQLVHLRSSLPFSQMTGTKVQQAVQTILPIELSESHELVANKVNAFGVQLHHLSLSGDWTILSRLGLIGEEARPVGEKQLAACASLLENSSEPSGIDLHIPEPLSPLASSLRMVDPGNSVGLATFPRSLLVYGWKITTLHLNRCELRELPHSIGLHMPNLKVSSAGNESHFLLDFANKLY